MSSSKQFVKKALNYALPVAGFGVGWVAFSVAEDKDWISENTQRKMNIANLKLQGHIQKLLPESVVEKYGYPEDILRSMIDSMEKGYTEQAMNDRVTFDEILSECELPEQMGFLEEHASEDIPYFYIADIFHSWARLHEATFLHAERRPKKATEKDFSDSRGRLASPGGTFAQRNIPELDSPILCHSLWVKLLNNVIPFDVSIRALCVLAVNNKANAKRLASICSVDDILNGYQEYEAKEKERTEARDKLIDHAEVYAATLYLLAVLNDASIHKRWIPGIGQPSSGRYPLASHVDADQWCKSFAPAKASREDLELVADPAALFCDVMGEKLKCSERPLL